MEAAGRSVAGGRGTELEQRTGGRHPRGRIVAVGKDSSEYQAPVRWGSGGKRACCLVGTRCVLVAGGRCNPEEVE